MQADVLGSHRSPRHSRASCSPVPYRSARLHADAVLSAVVFLIGVRLIDVKGMRRVFHLSKAEFIVAAITTIVVVAVGVEQGILLAIVLSIIDHLRHSYCPFDALIAPTPSGHWKAMPVEQGHQAAPGLVVYLFGAGLYYANSTRFSQEILKLVESAEPKIKWFAIEAAAITYIDFTAADTFQQVHKTLQKRGVTLVLSNVVDNVKKELDHYGLTALIGEEHFFDTLPEILEAYQNEINQKVEEPTREENIISSTPLTNHKPDPLRSSPQSRRPPALRRGSQTLLMLAGGKRKTCPFGTRR